MFDFALFILFCVMAYRVASGVKREASILREFGQSKVLGMTAFFLPLGPLALIFGKFWLVPIVAFLIALACYVPTFAIARRQGRVLEKAGTDRVQKAQSVISQAFGTALVGLIYVAIAVAMWVSVSNLSSVTSQ
jgi:hypothetical protein